MLHRLRSPRPLAVLIAAATGLALGGTPAAALASSGDFHAPPLRGAGHGQVPQRDLTLNQVNLASDVPGMAPLTDPDLKNPWGISFSPTSPLWVSNQGTNSSHSLRSPSGFRHRNEGADGASDHGQLHHGPHRPGGEHRYRIRS